MAKLVLLLNGQVQSELPLQSGREYLIGRDPQCDLVLENYKGISRQHLKVFHSSHAWVVELLSRVGRMYCEGEPVETAELSPENNISLPPYALRYEEAAVDSSKSLAPKTASTYSGSVIAAAGDHESESQTFAGNLESTNPGAKMLIAYLQIFYSSDEHEPDEVLKLEGNYWLAGREANCQIHVQDGHISRKHFEITRTDEGFFITDLGSANGTMLNGHLIETQKPAPLTSGDTIGVKNVSIKFEIHDERFKNQLQVINSGGPQSPAWPAHYSHPSPESAPGQNVIVERPSKGVARIKEFRLSQLKSIDYRKHKVRIALIALLPVLIYGLMDSPETEQKTQTSVDQAPFESLSEEQKGVIIDTYNLARNHLANQKYELCAAELEKLHGIIPFYEKSQEIQVTCVQGRQFLEEKRAEEERRRQKLLAQEKAVTIIEKCKSDISDTTKVAEVESCLAPAYDLDPENTMINELISQVEQQEEMRRSKAAAARAYRRRVNAGEALLRQAKSLQEKGQLREALEVYQKYLRGSYPDPNNKKQHATRELASVKATWNDKIDELLTSCKNLYEKREYKSAIFACRDIIKEDPKNQEAHQLARQAMSDLRREMKMLYDDSRIEESLGHIDPAKEKWKEIMQRDIEGEEYYEKAEGQLRKYGVGI